MTLPTLSAQQAAQLLKDGALLVDIRSPAEFARKHISAAASMPLDTLNAQQLPENTVIVFSCLSGMRTRHNATFLKDCAAHSTEVYLLEGGLNAWEKAGLPVETQSGAPFDLMRQTQIAAGILVLAGVILGTWVAPGFYFLSAFVGVGLLFAGITGFCGMARLLSCMPWNPS